MNVHCEKYLYKNKKVAHFNILGNKTIKRLKKGIKIGFGSSSKVFEVIKSKEGSNSESELFVLKEMKKNSLSIKNIKKFVNEYEIMISMNHLNIIKAFGIFLNKKQTSAFNSTRALFDESCSSDQIQIIHE